MQQESTSSMSAAYTALQRGDIISVALNDNAYVYQGVVTSATKRGTYVATRGCGSYYKPSSVGVQLTLIERRGLQSRNYCLKLAQHYP